MEIISRSLFAGDGRLTSGAATRHIAAALDAFSGARLQALLGLPRIALTPRARAGRRGQEYLRETLTQVVRDRIQAPAADDFLGRLIAALHERFEPGEAEALAVDNAATFYLAGHETTANAIAWALFLLSEQDEWQARVAEEARAALAVGTDDPHLPDRLPVLRQVLDETLRLYPSAPRMDRQAVAADGLGDEPVAPGDIVSIWPWLLHRHKTMWDDPDAFDPDRFAPERKAERHKFQYIPFGAGPRTCVGARFATAEALTILAHWLARWRFRPVPGHVVIPSGMVTLRPAGGLPLLVEPGRA
jgi:cytochrome P450